MCVSGEAGVGVGRSVEASVLVAGWFAGKNSRGPGPVPPEKLVPSGPCFGSKNGLASPCSLRRPCALPAYLFSRPRAPPRRAIHRRSHRHLDASGVTLHDRSK